MSDEPLVASSTVEEQAPPPEKLTGISVYPGIAYGLCQQFSAGDLEIPQFVIEKTGTRGEIQRLRAAIATVDKQLGALIDSADEDMPAEAAAFIDVHRTILRDPTLIEETVDIIKEKLVNAEWALSLRLEKTRRDFESIEDDYIRERIKDIAHVVLRVQRVLTGRRSASSLLEAEGLDETIILVADQLDPADMLLLRGRDDLDIAGIILEEGSITSHAVILARSLEIPTLVGVKGACEILETDVPVLLNADEELIDLSPSAEKRRNARQRMKLLTAEKKRLKKLKQFDAVTLDGHTIKLFANIALPEDVKDVHRAGADGVGLFRTEFLFMNRDDLPCEDEQYNAYCRVIRSMKGQPVVIRTADLGGDKVMSQDALEKLTTGPLEELRPQGPALLLCASEALRHAASRNPARRRHGVGQCQNPAADGHIARGRQQGARIHLAGLQRTCRRRPEVHRRRSARWNGRGSRRRHDAQGPDSRPRLLLARHQRPRAVHAGRRPNECSGFKVLRRVPPERAAHDRHDGQTGPPGRQERVRMR